MTDAYFSKLGFVAKLQDSGFRLVSRLRDDADLLYKSTGKQKKGRGRSWKYDSKIDFGQLRGQ
ncbi:hypothetical protein [Gillisia sp. Hel_I_86]|uniref:hypothetical protein n=1 Tax=Gillisia sp. Hel_I_86 TaxID=1249981 RepID=UPI0011A02CCB|nr:hypothetical protein [Gillisia sp. Hel_I_86]